MIKGKKCCLEGVNIQNCKSFKHEVSGFSWRWRVFVLSVCTFQLHNKSVIPECSINQNSNILLSCERKRLLPLRLTRGTLPHVSTGAMVNYDDKNLNGWEPYTAFLVFCFLYFILFYFILFYLFVIIIFFQ